MCCHLLIVLVVTEMLHFCCSGGMWVDQIVMIDDYCFSSPMHLRHINSWIYNCYIYWTILYYAMLYAASFLPALRSADARVFAPKDPKDVTHVILHALCHPFALQPRPWEWNQRTTHSARGMMRSFSYCLCVFVGRLKKRETRCESFHLAGCHCFQHRRR